MDLFNTNTEFVNYIFSLQWRENDPYKFECWPHGKFVLSDLINHLERLSDDVLLALYRDIILKAMHIRFEELSRVYPQEIFGNLYEDELELSNLERWIENNFPVANDILQYLETRIKGDTATASPQQADTPEAVTLPDKLATPEALKIFEQARELGLIDGDYKWLKGLQLLACFAREMSLKLGLGKGNNSDGTPRISWQPFERLFNISNGKLRANYNDVQKTGQDPSDHTLIDRIFK